MGSLEFAWDDGLERLPRRFNRVRHQHRDGHWPNAARHGCNRPRLFRNFVKSDVAHEPVAALACRVFDAINSHVDNDSAFADVIGFQKLCSANRRNNNVSRARNLREIAAARMHDGHRRVAVFVFLHQQ